MDELTAAERRTRKAEIVSLFQEEGDGIISSLPPDLDERVGEYARSVFSDPEAHNLFELLALRRFFTLLQSYDFKPNRVNAVITVLEALKFPVKEGMRPVRLSAVQVYCIANIYGFCRPDGRRLIRNVLLFVPR